MTQTVFGQIGPYVIQRAIGQGGMASVFLARDTRVREGARDDPGGTAPNRDATRPEAPNGVVALKVVHVGTDQEAREILESEQRGAELQQRFSALSRFVPKVYDAGFADDHFYIAMEYIAGEDLSQAIHRGRMPWQRAVTITMQLCEFLEDADRFEADATSRRVLLHNDLKPRNIRLMEGDAIKVLDFGAAKALSLSRKVTRNDFGSTAYLSPECLESGDRDVHTDAWALGVLLYEMVCGRQPYRADDTRRLEHLIRSRQAPEPISGYCPPALEAVIAKLLAPYPADRYSSPAEIHADLSSAQAGQDTRALAEGWPRHDEIPTRRTGHDEVAEPPNGNAEAAKRPNDDESPTRRTRQGETAEALNGDAAAAPRPNREVETARLPNGTDEPPTRRTGHAEAAKRPHDEESPTRRTLAGPERPGYAKPAASAATVVESAASLPPNRRVPRLLVTSLIIVFVTLALNEGCVASKANRLAHTVAVQDFAGLSAMWPQYESLAGWSFLGGAGVAKLETALTSQTMVLAERVMANYRTPLPTVRENQWKAARDALAHAVVLAPRDNVLRASLRYCEGHLFRINGEAAKARGQDNQAQQQFTEAVVAFREAAALRSNWPDPFLGLARTFIYGLEDVDRGADALAQAEKSGHHSGERETTQLADGYRARGDTLTRTAQTLKGMSQERDYLERAREAFREALTRYSTVSGFGNAAVNIRETQRRLDRVQERIDEISKSGWWPWD